MNKQKLKNNLTFIIEDMVAKAVAPRLASMIEQYNAGIVTPGELLEEIDKAASILRADALPIEEMAQ